MAKPHRIAALTIGSVAAALLSGVHSAAMILQITLWIILAGTLVTILRRTHRLLANLNARC